MNERINITFLYIIFILLNIYNCSVIIIFNSKKFRSGHFAFNSDGVMIIEYSIDKNRLFYGLKANGKYYFNDESQNKVPTKEITLEYGSNDVKRYEAKNIFVSIDDKEYLFSIAVDVSVVELFDLNGGGSISYKINLPENFIETKIYSYVFSLLEMDTDPKQYLISYYYANDYLLKKFQFSKFGLVKSNSDYTLTTSPNSYTANDYNNRIVSCFIMGSEIVVFLVGYNYKYLLFIYGFDLKANNIGNTPEIDSFTNYNNGVGAFSKAYHLENRDAIFIYFSSPSSSDLKLKTGTISTDNKSFTTKISKNINEYSFNFNVLLNDFVKIDSKRFVYMGLPSDDYKSIYIILFDLFNDYKSVNMRIYQEKFDNNHQIDQELAADVYNGHLIFTSTCIKDSSQYSILMIFGYANKTDNELDISGFFMDDNPNDQNNLVQKLLENVQIENNIFKYSLVTSEIKLVSIPNEILFYNKNGASENLISNGGYLKEEYTFKQNQNIEKTDGYYYLDYQPILEEPSYSNYNDGTITSILDSNTDYQNNYQQKRYYGRTITVKFKLCHQYCEKCKKYGLSNNNQLCLSCLQDYRYFNDKEFNSNCVPNGYFYDDSSNTLSQCTEENSKFYINLTDHRRICFKKSLSCPDEYPFLNETNNECLNYTLPSTITTTIPKIPTTIITTLPKEPTTNPEIPTTIITTLPKEPTTIITTLPEEPTTITKIPTTILTTIPKIPTTIATTLPKEPTTIPKIPTTIITTIPQIPTILPKMETTIQKMVTILPKIPTTIPTTIITTMPTTETIYPFICTYNEFLNDKCSFKNKSNTDIYNLIKKEIIPSYPPNGESIVIPGIDNYVFQVTNNINELSTINGSLINGYNLSMIDLAKCEDALRESNGIDNDIPLNFLKFERLSNLSIEKNIQYEIYALNSSEKLNLSVCKDIPVDIYIPIELSADTKIKYEDLKSQGYDLFNKSSSFYTDICTPYNSPNGTDVSLSTRNSEFYNSTETSCQENCNYGDYSSATSFLKCVCSVVEDDIETVQPEKFTGMTFLTSFYDVLKNSNYEVVKCYGLVLRLINFIVNIGSIITMVLFLFYLIFLIMYIFTGISKFKVEISKLLDKNENENEVNDKNIENNSYLNTKNFENQNKNNDLNVIIRKNNKKSKNHLINNKKKEKNVIQKKNKSNKNLLFNSNNKLQSDNKNIIIKNNNKNSFPPRKSLKRKEINNKINIIKNDISIGKNSKESNIMLNRHKSLMTNKLLFEKPRHNNRPKSIIIKGKNTIHPTTKIHNNNNNNNLENEIKSDYKYSNMELNEMEYLEAVENDKRSFCQMYWSILSREHLIIFTFFMRNDYNILSVKLSRFFFFVCTDMAMNVFFFTDESMHKIYKSYGKWDILQNIPQIIYSLLVSQAIQVFICYLTLTDKQFYLIKRLKFKGEKNINPIFKILKCIKIKLIIFYVVTFILFLAYWYIITSFCTVYKNTQIIFIKDSLTSFLSGILYPFVLYIFPALLRIISLKATKRNLSCLYKFSDFIPIF